MGKVRMGLGVTTKPPIKQLAKQLKAADPAAAKKLGKEHKRLGKIITDDARANAAASPHGAQQMAGKAFTPSSSATELKVIINAGGKYPMALAAYLGARQHSGWYSADRYAQSKGVQHPKWIGNQWTPGDSSTTKPYAIGYAIDDRFDEVIEGELDALESVFKDAFDKF